MKRTSANQSGKPSKKQKASKSKNSTNKAKTKSSLPPNELSNIFIGEQDNLLNSLLFPEDHKGAKISGLFYGLSGPCDEIVEKNNLTEEECILFTMFYSMKLFDLYRYGVSRYWKNRELYKNMAVGGAIDEIEKLRKDGILDFRAMKDFMENIEDNNKLLTNVNAIYMN